MHSENKRPLTPPERAHVRAVRHLPCSVCDAPGPSEAHHIDQDDAWTVVALCEPCHRGSDGWHGTRMRWKLRRIFTEVRALNVTLGRLLGARR